MPARRPTVSAPCWGFPRWTCRTSWARAPFRPRRRTWPSASPADLLRRRPDVRQAERLAAAQGEQIGIAEAQLYPTFSITGMINWQAGNLHDLFTSRAFNGNIGPQFQWNILNYGRIRSDVIYQDALFKELVVAYQRTVLQANQDAENGIVTFLRSQVQAKLMRESVDAANKAVAIVVFQYEKGATDFNRYATIEQALVTQQDSMAQAQGQIAQGLVQAYRALGGGWEIRCDGSPGAASLPYETPDPYCTRQALSDAVGCAAVPCGGDNSDAAYPSDFGEGRRLAKPIGRSDAARRDRARHAPANGPIAVFFLPGATVSATGPDYTPSGG